MESRETFSFRRDRFEVAPAGSRGKPPLTRLVVRAGTSSAVRNSIALGSVVLHDAGRGRSDSGLAGQSFFDNSNKHPLTSIGADHGSIFRTSELLGSWWTNRW